MGYIDVAGARHQLPDGRTLFDDVSFRVGEGAKAALVGANGTGKTTLLRAIAGDIPLQKGAIGRSGGLGVMLQCIGSVWDAAMVQEVLVQLAPELVHEAWEGSQQAQL